MRLKNLSIENFKSFKDKTELVDIKPLTIFVGPNNSGKSNIIRVFEFLSRLARNDFPNNWQDFIFDKMNEVSTIAITLELSETERKEIVDLMHEIDHLFASVDWKQDPLFMSLVYHLEFNNTGIVLEILSITNSSNELIPIIEQKGRHGNYVLSQIDLKRHIQESGATAFAGKELAQTTSGGITPGFFKNVKTNFAEGVIAQKIQTFFQKTTIVSPDRKPTDYLPPMEITRVEPNGANVAQVWNTMLNNSPEEFVDKTSRLKKFIPGLSKISAPIKGTNVTLRIFEDGRESFSETPEFSDGLKQSIVLTAQIQNAVPDLLFCVEEPEVNIHPSTQKELFKIFKENPNNNQFFITSHSPIFTGIGNEIDTYLVTKSKGRSNLLLIKEKEGLKFIKQELGIKNSDIYGYDGVIFVEGYSEEEALRVLGTAMGYETIGNTIRITNLMGAGTVKRLKQLLEYLKGSDTKVFLILDKHKEVSKEIPKLIEEKLINEKDFVVWDRDFEDSFSSKHIIESMKRICKKNSFKFNLDQETLDKERQSRHVFKIVQEHFHKLNSRDLNKRELARELALLIVKDRIENENHEDGPFEQTIKNIMARMEPSEKPDYANEKA